MKKTKFLQMLKAERERLGHSQKQTAEFIHMTQTAYSRMENGRTKISVKRSREIIETLEKHGYVGIPPVEIEEIDGVSTISFRWPFHRYWFYALMVVLIIVAIEYVVSVPGDYSRGLSAAENDEPVPDSSWVVYLAIAAAGIIYGLYRLIKRWRQ